MLPRKRRIAPRPRRCSHVGGKLRLQLFHDEVHSQLTLCSLVLFRHACLPVYLSIPAVKCLDVSACGRGITCTDISVPICPATSAPASVAAFTAPTSPLMMTATSPSPTS